MYYFKFLIPEGITYSPGWHGVMDRCPTDVTVLLCNDKEGYGIAKTEDSFVPDEVEVIDEKTALNYLSVAEDIDGVFFGDKLLHRYDKVIETLPENLTDITLDEFKAVLDGG